MNKWYDNLKKAPWTPPNYVFGQVWFVLYIMLFISFILILNNKKCKNFCHALKPFFIQLSLNLIWTSLFFYYKMPIIALFDILLIQYFTIQTYYGFKPINKMAANLLIPYFSWLCMALSLNFYVVLYN